MLADTLWMGNFWTRVTCPSFVLIPWRLKMASQKDIQQLLCVPSFDRTYWRTLEMYQSLSGFSLCIMMVASSCICYTGHMKPCWNAQKWKLTNIKLMDNTSAYFLYYHYSCKSVQWLPNSPLWERCNTEQQPTQPTKMTDILWQHSLLLTWSHLSRLVVRSFWSGFLWPCDIALGLSTEGFSPFKNHTKTACKLSYSTTIPPKSNF